MDSILLANRHAVSGAASEPLRRGTTLDQEALLGDNAFHSPRSII